MYVLVGLVYSKDDEKRVFRQSKDGMQMAANNYQWALIRGLHGVTGEKVHVLNSVPMGAFPRHCKILWEKSRRVSVEEAEIYSNSYLNISGVKQLMRRRYIYQQLKKLIKNAKEPVTVIAYSMYNPYMSALSKLKKKGEKFNYILLVPDMPGAFGAKTAPPVHQFLLDKMSKKTYKLYRDADAYVLLTEEMSNALELQGKPYVVVEGICNNEVNIKNEYHRHDPPHILYTGVCDNGSGLDLLLDAFSKIPAGTAELHLAGPGNQKMLESLEKKNACIKYWGMLPRDKALEKQRNADILVNPRSSESEHTKYSFPSKTMEYLSTGVPVVMNKLPGIPKEYYPHLFLTENSDADCLAQRLQDVLKMDEEELLKHGVRGACFIRDEKNGITQTQKIVKLAEKLLKQT